MQNKTIIFIIIALVIFLFILSFYYILNMREENNKNKEEKIEKEEKVFLEKEKKENLANKEKKEEGLLPFRENENLFYAEVKRVMTMSQEGWFKMLVLVPFSANFMPLTKDSIYYNTLSIESIFEKIVFIEENTKIFIGDDNPGEAKEENVTIKEGDKILILARTSIKDVLSTESYNAIKIKIIKEE